MRNNDIIKTMMKTFHSTLNLAAKLSSVLKRSLSVSGREKFNFRKNVLIKMSAWILTDSNSNCSLSEYVSVFCMEKAIHTVTIMETK